jgi:hypothetical protein
MNTQTTPFSAHDLPVPAVHEAGSPRLGYSAFRLDALALNADLAALGTAGPCEPTDQVHWIMETEHLSAMVLSGSRWRNAKACAAAGNVPCLRLNSSPPRPLQPWGTR